MIGRLQLAADRARDEDNEAIIHLRILRTQVGLIATLFVSVCCILPTVF